MQKVIKLSNIGLMVMLVNRAFDSDNIYTEYTVATPEGMLYDVTPVDMCTFLGMYYTYLGREQIFFRKPIMWGEGQVMANSDEDSQAFEMLNSKLGTKFTVCKLDANGYMEFE